MVGAHIIDCMHTATAAIGANVNSHGPGPGANTTGLLHNMGSMAFGMGTSAVGSPGFGQFSGPNSSRLVSNAGLETQPGGSLFSQQSRSHTGGDQQQGTYHPFGLSGGLLQDHGLNPGVSTSAVIICRQLSEAHRFHCCGGLQLESRSITMLLIMAMGAHFALQNQIQIKLSLCTCTMFCACCTFCATCLA